MRSALFRRLDCALQLNLRQVPRPPPILLERSLASCAFSLAAFAAALLAASPALAQASGDKPKSLDAIHSEALIEQAKSGYADAPVDERTVQTRHSVAVSGRTLPYTATAGTLTIRDVAGKPKASIFYTAYTLDGARGGNRPVMFFYNGGPGSATLWLHMGSFGPMRLLTGSPEFIRPAPFAFGPNPDTLLGATDMVFIDAPGTGYSRPLGDAKAADFYGVDQDADAFARAILRYVTKFGRWNSPKFLFGESYGTTRSGALAYQLQDRGMALNGVILLSSIMNYGRRQPGLDHVYLNYLPSYAATAWYHHKMANPPATVGEAAARGARFRRGPYAVGARQGPEHQPGGARFRRPADERADRAFGRLHQAREPARRPRPLPQGAAARPAPDRRPVRLALHGRRFRRRRRNAGL